jgi:hypothetical protein
MTAYTAQQRVFRSAYHQPRRDERRGMPRAPVSPGTRKIRLVGFNPARLWAGLPLPCLARPVEPIRALLRRANSELPRTAVEGLPNFEESHQLANHKRWGIVTRLRP